MNRLTFAVPALALGSFGLLALAGPASAHVTVNPSTASAGAYAKLTFRVPTESDTASTKRLEVYFPADQPLAAASVQPHAGWTYQVVDHQQSGSEAVQKIVWTADSPQTQIHPGEFDEFNISVGPLPEADSMVFKALQYYTDGSVVRWIEPTVEGQPRPEHPAPVLTLTPADAGTSTDAAAGTAGSDAAEAAPAEQQPAPDHTPIILATIALVVSVGAFALSVLRRTRA